MKPKLTLREKLDLIDSWLCENSEDAEKLSHILSAIRGPDSEYGDAVKQETTNVIRKAAFPMAWERAGGRCGRAMAAGSRTGWDMWDTADKFKSPKDNHSLGANHWYERHGGCGWHFTSHVEAAAHALGLIGD